MALPLPLSKMAQQLHVPDGFSIVSGADAKIPVAAFASSAAPRSPLIDLSSPSPA